MSREPNQLGDHPFPMRIELSIFTKSLQETIELHMLPPLKAWIDEAVFWECPLSQPLEQAKTSMLVAPYVPSIKQDHLRDKFSHVQAP